jgi:hypothetical protein
VEEEIRARWLAPYTAAHRKVVVVTEERIVQRRMVEQDFAAQQFGNT